VSLLAFSSSSEPSENVEGRVAMTFLGKRDLLCCIELNVVIPLCISGKLTERGSLVTKLASSSELSSCKAVA